MAFFLLLYSCMAHMRLLHTSGCNLWSSANTLSFPFLAIQSCGPDDSVTADTKAIANSFAVLVCGLSFLFLSAAFIDVYGIVNQTDSVTGPHSSSWSYIRFKLGPRNYCCCIYVTNMCGPLGGHADRNRAAGPLKKTR